MSENFGPREMLDRFDGVYRRAMFDSEEDIRKSLQNHGLGVANQFTDIIGRERFRPDERTLAMKRRNYLEVRCRREVLIAAAMPFEENDIGMLDTFTVNWLAREELFKKISYDILFFPPGSRRIADYDSWNEDFRKLIDERVKKNEARLSIQEALSSEDGYYTEVQWRRFAYILGLEQLADMLTSKFLSDQEHAIDVIDGIINSNRERLNEFPELIRSNQPVLQGLNAQVIAEAYPYRLSEIEEISRKINSPN